MIKFDGDDVFVFYLLNLVFEVVNMGNYGGFGVLWWEILWCYELLVVVIDVSERRSGWVGEWEKLGEGLFCGIGVVVDVGVVDLGVGEFGYFDGCYFVDLIFEFLGFGGCEVGVICEGEVCYCLWWLWWYRRGSNDNGVGGRLV